ncbi:hypothetical protein CPB83DRAFT_511002 [Crepidotus variabilis]|uniref:Uncharacterized protein n=1 Tax=Crepidotus variabilis TaxID=179855 RepID=A0A9P6EBM2_9AGAR|nr:hypothetical protein CPB83DRAFT_511002 [Crepidotus variabilis]
MKVENTRFRVPKTRFLISDAHFFDRFENKTYRHSAEYPIILTDTTAETLNGLVTVMYPLKKSSEITHVEWIGALDLATRWGLKDIRDEAVASIPQLLLSEASPQAIIKHIIAGRKYQVPAWISEGYRRLVGKPDLDLEELQTLDPKTSSHILDAQLRITRTQLHKQLGLRPKERCLACAPFSNIYDCNYTCGRGRVNKCGSCRNKEGEEKCIYTCANNFNNTHLHGVDIKEEVKRIPLQIE